MDLQLTSLFQGSSWNNILESIQLETTKCHYVFSSIYKKKWQKIPFLKKSTTFFFKQMDFPIWGWQAEMRCHGFFKQKTEMWVFDKGVAKNQAQLILSICGNIHTGQAIWSLWSDRAMDNYFDCDLYSLNPSPSAFNNFSISHYLLCLCEVSIETFSKKCGTVICLISHHFQLSAFSPR